MSWAHDLVASVVFGLVELLVGGCDEQVGGEIVVPV